MPDEAGSSGKAAAARSSAAGTISKPRSRTSRKKPGGKSASAGALQESFLRHLHHTIGRNLEQATPRDLLFSACMMARDLAAPAMIATRQRYRDSNCRRTYYLSLEHLIGPQLRQNLFNLGAWDDARAALRALSLDLDEICQFEPEPGLGNGGLGRLAACLMESAATMSIPLTAYGLRYQYGIFQQQIVGGWQVERPDYWRRGGWAWEFPRPEDATAVRLYGYVVDQRDEAGRYRATWRGARQVLGMPYDVPIVGHGGGTANILRLWSAESPEGFDLTAFNRGGFVEAVRDQALAETITRVLYPDDRAEANRELRLTQQYFFVACSMSDILRRHEEAGGALESLPQQVAVQLNDTHPALAITELMRILMDERGLGWEGAWKIAQPCLAYTNHTLLPEALEVWPVALLERVLPRHLQIIFEINRRFLDQVEQRWPRDVERRRNCSLVQEWPTRGIRMAHLATVSAARVNGVAPLHSQLLKTTVLRDLAELAPQKFTNVTNGVSHRRWLAVCNPALAALITEAIGQQWVRDATQLRKLEPLADDAAFQERFAAVRRENKVSAAAWIMRRTGTNLPVEALFDVHVKRLHEYKRQLLNILHAILEYQRLVRAPDSATPPRVKVFSAKAAPGYLRAKLIIKLINDVATVVNSDERMRGRLRIVFVPDYNVSVAERLIPAADLSEQISLAGTEASGTGNMKLALNGALTIGTLDGANVDIRQAVGPENFFEFGLTEPHVRQTRGEHDPYRIYDEAPAVREALDAIRDGAFSPAAPGQFQEIFDALTRERDYYMVLADLADYERAQRRVEARWGEPAAWLRSAILNVARSADFSSDRSILDYSKEIWQVGACPETVASAGRRGRHAVRTVR